MNEEDGQSNPKMCLRSSLNSPLDDVWDEDSAYVEMLANEGQRLREKSEKQAAGEEVSDDEDEEDIEEELGYISPLDNVDPYITFKAALTGQYCLSLRRRTPLLTSSVAFQMKNGHGYQLATTSLTPDHQTFLMEVMRLADEHAAAPAS